jgi:hypothetical protein
MESPRRCPMAGKRPATAHKWQVSSLASRLRSVEYADSCFWRVSRVKRRAPDDLGTYGGGDVMGAESAFGPTRGTGRPRDRATGDGIDRPGRWPRWAGTRPPVARVLALAAVAAVAIPLMATGCSSSSSSSPPKSTPSAASTAKHRTHLHCGSAGCAMVRTSVSAPQPTVFYGASCSGIHGSWFFNAVEGGGSNVLRPSYALNWSFAGAATMAKPSARVINVPRTKTTTVSLTLSNGRLKLSGVRKPNGTVSATGSLIVRLSGTASSPSLTFVERGLVPAEHRLGLVSPFNAHGHPLVVPIRHVTSLPGC